MRLFNLIRNLKILSKAKIDKNSLNSFLSMNYNEMLKNILYYIPNSNIIRPKVLNDTETIDFLNNTNSSIVRFGDGEIEIIEGKGIPYQEYNVHLANRLKEIITTQQDNLIVGINHWYYYPVYNQNDCTVIKNFQLYNMPIYRNKLDKYINYTTQYCDAGFTSFKGNNVDLKAFFDKIKNIWKDKNILIVGCKNAIDTLSYNVFDTAKTSKYLFVPNKNAFSEYKQIYEEILTYDKNILIVLMAGPTAKVLAADLTQIGYRVLDMGHIAKSYDYYLKQLPDNDDNVEKFYCPD